VKPGVARLRVAAGVALATVATLSAFGCVRSPSPLTPQNEGSVGLPHRGSLSHGTRLPSEGTGFARLRKDERRYGTERLVGAIERAAAVVEKARPGSVLVIGDLSATRGGRVLPHLSHRNGRDADLLLYVSTPSGAMVTSPGFVHFGPDGLAWDAEHDRYLRFDVEREWLLVKTLVEDDDARVQWIFLNHALQPMLIDWARARGEPLETIRRAEQVLLEPKPGGVHDDHTHIRVACGDDEIAHGCEPNGPERPWFTRAREPVDAPSTDELVREISAPLEAFAGPPAP
jgi:penicillin-insensitive murein endopeptidase